ncbi:MAG: pyridoxal-phosphate dependent enzyme [Maribacter sp.]
MISTNQEVQLSFLKDKQITLFVKREDLIHPYISGNKYRKLKYNLIEAEKKGFETVLTFGGAYSNHIAATAFAASEKGFKSIGIIRGEELKEKWAQNPTLKKAHADGMLFRFVSREMYRKKSESSFLSDLEIEFGEYYLIPEGGTNTLAVKGCEEILTKADEDFDIVATCVGTGGTIAGLINSIEQHQQVIGFPALKGDFLQQDIEEMVDNKRWSLNSDYHFGGYGKITEELVLFINDFKKRTDIPLDPIYSGKMLYGLLDMVKHDTFAPRTKILAVHTGGLQGIEGMNSVLKKKKLPLLDI